MEFTIRNDIGAYDIIDETIFVASAGIVVTHGITTTLLPENDLLRDNDKHKIIILADTMGK